MRFFLQKVSCLAAFCVLGVNQLNAQTPNPKLSCYDGMSFGAGRIHIVETADRYQILLRGFERHGRSVGDLARDFAISLEESGYLNWVGVSFPKHSCRWSKGAPFLGQCDLVYDSPQAEVVFYTGANEKDLTEVARGKGERLMFSLQDVQLTSFAGATESNVRATLFVFANTPNLYQNTVSVEFASQYCK